ncbi:hypothetical protein ACFQXB_11155 [Plastorhodobacter daqingensis]|uniref:Uncharacterized protein n=1 Tax=Plastorhodobacter daqingensis TaxID=1387281 RepID=A0ABW2UJ64_9RHOB
MSGVGHEICSLCKGYLGCINPSVKMLQVQKVRCETGSRNLMGRVVDMNRGLYSLEPDNSGGAPLPSGIIRHLAMILRRLLIMIQQTQQVTAGITKEFAFSDNDPLPGDWIAHVGMLHQRWKRDPLAALLRRGTPACARE